MFLFQRTIQKNQVRQTPRKGFQRSLLISYAIFMTLLIAFVIIFWGVIVSLEHQRNQQNNNTSLLMQLNYALNDVTDGINRILYYHNEDSRLLEIYERLNSGAAYLPSSDRLYAENILTSLAKLNSYVGAIVYTSPDHNIFLYSDKFTFPEQDLTLLTQHVPGGSHSSFYDEPVYGFIDKDRLRLIPVIRHVANVKTGHDIGYVIVFVDANRLFPQIDTLSGASDNCYTVISGNGILYGTNLSIHFFDDNKKIASFEDITAFTGTRLINSDPYEGIYSGLILSAMRHTRTGWTIIKFRQAARSGSAFGKSIIIFVTACLLFYFLLLGISFRYSHRISRDLLQLHKAICSVNIRELQQVSIPYLPDNEIGDLISAYNDMIETLDRSIKREYLLEIQTKDAQILMLNYQIDPHYLYNCLNLITSLATLNNVPIISDVSSALGDMFHYNTKGRRFVTIREEVDILQKYVLIQNLRFPDQFEVIYNIEENLLDKPCIKFILQPLVENCFKHAFHTDEDNPDRNRIEVCIRLHDEAIVVTIVDNGIGMSAEMLSRINRILDSHPDERPEEIGIGIWNLNERIYYYYGEGYGLHMESTEGEYTKAILRFPVT